MTTIEKIKENKQQRNKMPIIIGCISKLTKKNCGIINSQPSASNYIYECASDNYQVLRLI